MKPGTSFADGGQDSKLLSAPRTPPPPTPPPVERRSVLRQIPLAPPRQEEQPGSGVVITRSSGWFASILLHVLLLFILALIVPVVSVDDRLIVLVPRTDPESSAEVELAELTIIEQPELKVDPIEEIVDIDRLLQNTEKDQSDILDQVTAVPILVGPMSVSVFRSEPSALIRLPSAMSRTGHASGDNSATLMVGMSGNAGANNGAHGELGGRASRRMRLATAEMNYAINNGLNWLARHQLADGGWSFDHQIGECQGRCPDRGIKRNARVAATGLALLPFLGAGHSPLHGDYRGTVSAGINFLIANTSREGSLWYSEGRMYGHGIATLALCECYGIMKQTPPQATDNANLGVSDSAYPPPTNIPLQLLEPTGAVDVERLKRTAAAAIDFIVRAQAKDGGWRYRPGELGDTSVVGWQVMALKSAKEAGFEVSRESVSAAGHFLDLVQLDPIGDSSGVLGTRYAYKPDKRTITPATTAIGHACRLCMGASLHHPAIETTVKQMVTDGHRGGDLYYNFYANQVVFQYGGTQWAMWSQELNKDLIRLQKRNGHLQGSWHFGNADAGGTAGGRLYATAMSCLCLEETFRHLPVFRINAERRFADRLRAAMTTLPGERGLAVGGDEPDSELDKAAP